MKKTIIIPGVIVLLIIAALALLRIGVRTLPGALLTMTFPAVTWGDEPVEDVAAASPDELDSLWRNFEGQLADIKSSKMMKKVGVLMLPTGTILATDLNFVEGNRPFRRLVPPGKYPVYECRTVKGSLAVVMIVSGRTPSRWVVADAFGDTLAQLKSPIGPWGINLDSSAIFVDAVVCTKQSRFNPGPIINQTTLSVTVDPASGANAVCTELGGVGVHKAYWGLDEEGQPIALLATGN